MIEILLAYIVADALTGIVGWFFGDKVRPKAVIVDVRPFALGGPIILISLFKWHPVFWGTLGIFICFAEIPRYWAHNAHRMPSVVGYLQDLRIVICWTTYDKRYRGLGCNYCIMSGWNNWWLNFVVRALRAKRVEVVLETKLRELSAVKDEYWKAVAKIQSVEETWQAEEKRLGAWREQTEKELAVELKSYTIGVACLEEKLRERVAETEHWMRRATTAEMVLGHVRTIVNAKSNGETNEPLRTFDV